MSEISVKHLVLGPIETNCYIIRNGDKIAVVDPAAAERNLLEAVSEKNTELTYILLTHGHFDHISGVNLLKKYFPNAKIVVNAGDEEMLYSAKFNCSWMLGESFTVGEKAFVVSDGDVLPFGGDSFTVLHTPGHSKGSCCYQLNDLLFCGDTVFADGGYGRTDLYGGSDEELETSLARILRLPPETKLYSGHGSESTVGDERHFHPELI